MGTVSPDWSSFVTHTCNVTTETEAEELKARLGTGQDLDSRIKEGTKESRYPAPGVHAHIPDQGEDVFA